MPFNAASSPYLSQFINDIRPSYTTPSRYVLSHTILNAEHARVMTEEIERLGSRRLLTLLIDGWEDKLRRSLYGVVAAEINEFPVILGLRNLTGQRGSAASVLETATAAMKSMDVEDGRNFIACTTDNPAVMQSFRRMFQGQYSQILVCNYPQTICVTY